MSEIRQGVTSPTGAREPGLEDYRAVSALAVGGFVLAILAPLALWHPVLWCLPVAGIVVCGLALRRIQLRAPELLGRGLAVAALALSVALAAAAPARFFSARLRSEIEARDVVLQWFDFLRQDEPQRAFQLYTEPSARRPGTEDLWAYYRKEPGGAEYLRGFVAEPLVRTMLALGPAAQVRFYETEMAYESDRKEVMILLFAVTYEADGQRTTFFARFVVERKPTDPRGTAYWKITRSSLVDAPPDSWPRPAVPAAN